MRKNKERKFHSPIKKKILLLLMAGISLGLKKRTLSGQIKIIKKLRGEWKKVDRQYLYRILNEFKYDRLVTYNEKKDGQILIELTEKGRLKTLEFKVDEITIKNPIHWDRKWRVVIFDIPEKKRKIRDALRSKLQELGFYEWQKSVFIHPFPCQEEIDFIMEFFESRHYVRYAELLNPTNEAELKLHFNLYNLK